MTAHIEGNNFRVEENGEKMSIGIPENLKAQVNRLMRYCLEKKNGYIHIKIGLPRRQRTSGIKSQNNCIHGYASQIAWFTGNDIDDVLTAAKRRAFKRGYPAMKDDSGNVIMSMNYEGPIPESSANITTVEAGYLIKELEQIADELGIVLKDE